MLYLEDLNGDFEPWTGQAINGVKHPLSIERLWTAEQLAEIRLYAPQVPAIPSGKQVASSTVQRIDGVVKFVYVLTDEPAPTPLSVPLTDRQLRLGLVLGGVPLDVVQTAIDSIPDPTQRIIAQIWWDRSTVIEWGHVMTQSLMGMVGISPEDAATMWIAASQLEA